MPQSHVIDIVWRSAANHRIRPPAALGGNTRRRIGVRLGVTRSWLADRKSCAGPGRVPLPYQPPPLR